MPSCNDGNSGSRVIESTSTTGQFPVDVRRLSTRITGQPEPRLLGVKLPRNALTTEVVSADFGRIV